MKYDAIVIGGGPGGYIAAERLAAAGKKVMLVEKQNLGGTCLNVGCIPTKTLLNSAKHYLHAEEAAAFGVHAEKVSYNFDEMMAWKENVVKTLRGGIASMMRKLKIDVVTGTGQLVSAAVGGDAKVKIAESGDVHEATSVIIATGSLPAMPPIPGSKGNPRVLDSTGLLSISEVPKRLAVIGGGVIGIEFASLFGTLGSKVSVVEMMDEIIPPMDKDHAPILRKSIKNTEFHLGCKVERIEDGKVCFKTKDGKDASVEADLILMAVGRRSETSNWLGKEAGADIGRRGVEVDDRMRTNLPGVWAVGDVNGRSMLAHSASRMAEVAVGDILGQSGSKMRYNAVPWVVYSIPEAAGVGMTEQEAAAKNIAVKTASSPMLVSGRFIAENGTKAPGAVKVIADAGDGRILGVHVLGPYASEMIWGAAALIENEMRVKDVKDMIFPHPTVCEAIRDTIWSFR